MILQWIDNKLMQRKNKLGHEITKLNWKKAELEKLLANKENMSPEEFKMAYQKLN